MEGIAVMMIAVASVMLNAALLVVVYVKDHELNRLRRLYRDACHGFIPFNMWEADDDDA